MAARESGGRPEEGCGALSAAELVARLQHLVDTRPVETKVPLEWAVSAYFLGDLRGPACLSLRSAAET